MAPPAAVRDRFSADLDRLAPAGSRLGVGVSGGPDSLALLVLAADARPGQVEAATVDHHLRPGSGAEAEAVRSICAAMGVPHTILGIEWPVPLHNALQEQARTARYQLLGQWLRDRRLDALLTAHHCDDQAETLLMRLNRGAGVRGLAGMRASAPLPDGSGARLLRPLLGWRREELVRVCENAGLKPIDDPSNEDQRFERSRVRTALRGASWIDPEALARSANNLASADQALDWAVALEWQRNVHLLGHAIAYRPDDAPSEIRRRIVSRAIAALATEGAGSALRGRDLDRLLASLDARRSVTLRGVRCTGGIQWRFEAAPPRRTPPFSES